MTNQPSNTGPGPQRPKKLCATPGCRSIVTRGLCDGCKLKRERRMIMIRVSVPLANTIVDVDPAGIELKMIALGHRHKQFYNSKEWIRARADYIAEHPLCEICDRMPTQEVHHKVGLAKDWERRFDRTNFQATCTPCHSRETARLDRGFGRAPKRSAE